jgi:hypothetical protein
MQQPERTHQESPAGVLFRQLDRNGDGVITKEEFLTGLQQQAATPAGNAADHPGPRFDRDRDRDRDREREYHSSMSTTAADSTVDALDTRSNGVSKPERVEEGRGATSPARHSPSRFLLNPNENERAREEERSPGRYLLLKPSPRAPPTGDHSAPSGSDEREQPKSGQSAQQTLAVMLAMEDFSASGAGERSMNSSRASSMILQATRSTH